MTTMLYRIRRTRIKFGFFILQLKRINLPLPNFLSICNTIHLPIRGPRLSIEHLQYISIKSKNSVDFPNIYLPPITTSIFNDSRPINQLKIALPTPRLKSPAPLLTFSLAQIDQFKITLRTFFAAFLLLPSFLSYSSPYPPIHPSFCIFFSCSSSSSSSSPPFTAIILNKKPLTSHLNPTYSIPISSSFHSINFPPKFVSFSIGLGWVGVVLLEGGRGDGNANLEIWNVKCEIGMRDAGTTQ